MTSTVEKLCEHCEQNFNAPVRDVNRGRARFCSRNCSAQHNGRLRIEAKVNNSSCALCQKEFYRTELKKKVSRSGLQFCSRHCKEIAQRIGGFAELQLPHYGNGTNYRDIAFRVHPKICMRCGYDKNEAAICVHHIDRNRDNNTIENLEVLCWNCHAIEHHGEAHETN